MMQSYDLGFVLCPVKYSVMISGNALRAYCLRNLEVGLTTKIHEAVDALGNPVRLLLTAGQASEYGQANALIEGFSADYVLADKGYDSDAFVQTITDSGAEPVIPSRKNKKKAQRL